MSQGNSPIKPESVGRISQIIAGALIFGLVAYSCLAIGISQSIEKDLKHSFPMIVPIAIALTGVQIVVWFVVPTIIANRGKARIKKLSDNERSNHLVQVYLLKTIVSMALLEGAGFLNLTVYIMERQLLSCGVVVVLLGVMAISFPSQGQFESWAEEMKRDLN